MNNIRDVAKDINSIFESKIVGELSRNWRKADQQSIGDHKEFIKQNYIHPMSYWNTPGGANDLDGLTAGRLDSDRRTYIPWINDFLPLKGSRILELGSGTGSSTIALAEQGAEVTGVDFLEPGIQVARDKCRIYGVEAKFVVGNAVDYMEKSKDIFDAVIFFAVLEHMLPEERIKALSCAWRILRPGGFLIIIEAPNRLWYYDGHTSVLPFFNWLPAKLALEYIKFSPRSELVDLLTPPSESNLEELQRWGLGVSFHEIDISLGREVRKLARKSLGNFLRRRSPLRYLGWHLGGDAKYSRFLRRAAPDVDRAWFEPNLNLAIQHP